MNPKSIGDYLRRLRVRSNYTQSDLGRLINVTGKAISRWESGTGMPEIGNLMVLAKLFGVTVDDILNCNESVFTEEEKAADSVGSPLPEQTREAAKEAEIMPENTNGERQTDKTSPAANTDNAGGGNANFEAMLEYMKANGYNIEKKKKKPMGEVKHAKNFLPMLLFAFLSPGGLVFSTGDYMITFTGIAISVLAVGIGVITFLENKLPKKAYYITLIVLYSLVAFTLMLFAVLQLAFPSTHLNYGGYQSSSKDWEVDDEYVRSCCASGCWTLVLAVAMQVFYLIADFVKSNKANLALRIVAAIVAAAIIIVGVVLLGKMAHHSSLYADHVAMQTFIVGVTVAVFAVAECTTHWVKLGAAACVLAGIIVPVAIPNNVEIIETFITLPYSGSSGHDNPILPMIYFVIAMAGPMLTALMQVIENTEMKPNAVKWMKMICAAIGAGCLVPLTVYTFDALAADLFLPLGPFQMVIYALFMRLFVIAAAILIYVRYFISALKKKEVIA